MLASTRVVFVTPSELSSGEAITVLHMAEDVARRGGKYTCLASPFTAQFLAPRLGAGVTRLSADAGHNRSLWERTLRTFRPDVVVFADYPFLFFSSGIAPLADERWVTSLEALDALAITLDHLGYAQRVMRVYFGPPHLSLHSEVTPPLPPSMRVLLPCPMNEPGPVSERTGTPFRYLDLLPDGGGPVARRPASTREMTPLLVVHTTPTWAWRIAMKWGLPHYAFLSEILDRYLGGLPVPVRVVSVNNGELLRPSRSPGVQVQNSGVLPPGEYDRLLAAADLVITDNAVSSTAGKAVCALKPVAQLHNTRRLADIVEDEESWPRSLALAMERARCGAVFPFEVFPLWSAADLELLGLLRENSVAAAVEKVEMFGGESSRRRIQGVLMDDIARADLRRRQLEYVEHVARLPGPGEVLEAMVAGAHH